MKLMSVKKKQERKLEMRDYSPVSEYNIALKNEFDCLEPEFDLESMWNSFEFQDICLEIESFSGRIKMV